MAAFILALLFIWASRDAFRHYDAARSYESRRGRNVNFFAFMFQNHPLVLVGLIVLVILIGAVIFAPSRF